MIENRLCDVWNATLPESYSETTIINAEKGRKPECRAFRIVNDSLKFLFLKVPRKYPDNALKLALTSIVHNGVEISFRLDDGRIGFLEFAFLGFTESTIKSGHVILLQKTVHNSRDAVPPPTSLLKSFGDLREVFNNHGPGKYAARLGLSFSATVESINPAASDVAQIPDSHAEDGVLTTDGCGIIRESYAREICDRHNFKARTSVFQIRRGGIKGLLVAYPDDHFDNICRESGLRTSDEYKLAYRPSMLKYEGGPTHIEINRISEPPKAARLSLSVIVVLTSLVTTYGGIGLFFRGLKQLLKLQLRSIGMIAYDRQEALDYIEGELDAEGDSFYQNLYEMLLAGHSLDDAYIRKQLRNCQSIQYENLREKLNIKIQKSCYVYGVVDELGVLAEDEVYLQLPQREGILVARVLVARHPSHRPSDVRLMKAVNKPQLQFLTNCIVFPRMSSYSIPGSMSGGDLDGDKYFVCWEPMILPRKTIWPSQSSLPRNATKIDWSRRSLKEELVNLFVEQHHNRLLGMASMEWQSVVEKYRCMAGARYPRELAGVIEEALDILKTGGSYKALQKRYRDILSENSVESENIKRRRSRLRTIKNMIPSIDEDKNIRYTYDPDLILREQSPRDWKKHVDEGQALIRQFNLGLRDAIMKDEEERQHARDNNTWRRRTEDGPSFADLHIKYYIDRYFPRASHILSEVNTTSYIRASAWYYVGYEENKPTFAWLGARFLHSIKSFKTNGGRPGISVGALKKVQEPESLNDPERPIWLYFRRWGGHANSSYEARVNRVHLDAIAYIENGDVTHFETAGLAYVGDV